MLFYSSKSRDIRARAVREQKSVRELLALFCFRPVWNFLTRKSAAKRHISSAQRDRTQASHPRGEVRCCAGDFSAGDSLSAGVWRWRLICIASTTPQRWRVAEWRWDYAARVFCKKARRKIANWGIALANFGYLLECKISKQKLRVLWLSFNVCLFVWQHEHRWREAREDKVLIKRNVVRCPNNKIFQKKSPNSVTCKLKIPTKNISVLIFYINKEDRL